ncbi:hypothetical protein [Cyclobacterium jeungdonense]|uniref:FG-GAP repeat protein n=1 Tax=Cyclobacterium jeungdonense TaxID=708087 RepID=A0ABT8C1U7_9BACT|nr:hypothetical protein [Cyclobacterium jeungdonense]MDN3686764.1 hypothetical protein [Cyclobacterium jeungdonense]
MRRFGLIYWPARYAVWSLALIMLSCQKKDKSALIWDARFPVIGSQSSPRPMDLNGDGIQDLVMGAGKNEFEASAYGIIAIDGANGEILWHHAAEDQVFGSASFQDVNGDGTPDVFIGGRGPYLKGIDGRSGDLIWKFDTLSHQHHPVLRHGRFNFTNSVWIPDQNGDGLDELLICNGGNSKAAPYETKDRYPGILMVINPWNGDVLAADSMPDGGETYLSPVVIPGNENEDYRIAFGTGGETISGSLYLANLKDLMKNDLSKARKLVSESGHGFIASPVLVDLDRDGILDIVAISHSSSISAISGKTLDLLWEQNIPHTECSNSFAVGQFTDDDIPDLFTFVSKGVWPENTGSVQVLIDGETGNVVRQEELGCTGFSSPVAYDLNRDGIDEVLFSINDYDCERAIDDESAFLIENKLLIMDFASGELHTLDQSKGFKNIFSTPWIGDLDQDGYLDLVHCQYFSHTDILSFLGMRVKRIDLPIKVREAPVWGSLMGSEGDGIYQK